MSAGPYDALLLVSFGGPEGQDDVLPFLRNVTAGRGIPDERLEEVAHHYRHFGGVSPINDQNRALAAALETELAARGLDLPLYWGNRNWSPYLADAVQQAYDDGHRRLLALVTSAYSSYSSCRQYREDLAAALQATGLAGEVTIDKVRQYFDHPGFVTPFVEGVRAALGRARDALGRAGDAVGSDGDAVGSAGDLARDAHVLFVTHSIPTSTALTSGPPDAGLGEEGAYGAQHRAVAEVVMAAVGSGAWSDAGSSGAASSGAAGSDPASSGTASSGTAGSAADVGGAPDVPWSLVFQSRSGAPTTPWLEPDINDEIRRLAAAGTRAVVIVPLGFVSDHMEVLWDLDEEAMETARDVGVWAERTPTPGIDPAFVAGLVDLVTERTERTGPTGPTGPTERTERTGPTGPTERTAGAPRPALTALGPWHDVCPVGCCANPRGARPAVAGEDPTGAPAQPARSGAPTLAEPPALGG